MYRKLNNKELKKIEEMEKDGNVRTFCQGKLLVMARNAFGNEEDFKNWIYDLYDSKFKNSNNPMEKEKYYEGMTKRISIFQEQERKIKTIKTEIADLKKNKENVITEEEIEEFLEELELKDNSLVALTDIEDEIKFISELIKNKNARSKYLSNNRGINYLFNVKRMSEIFTILKEIDIDGEDLSENLIKKDFTYHELKCIFAIRENNSRSIEDIYSNLKKYAELRKYDRYDNENEITDFLIEVCNSDNFCNLTVKELTDYLDTFLVKKDSGRKYVLKEGYNYVKLATNYNITEYFNNKEEQKAENVDMPFNILNRCIEGFRKGQLVGIGMLSNAGKTRFLIDIVVYLIFVATQKVLLILNETTQEDFLMCLITTVLNNTDLRSTYNLSSKKEKEIRNIRSLEKQEDKDFSGFLLEIQEKINENLVLQITDNYTDENLENMIVKSYYEEGISYVFYDTLKANLQSTNTTDDLSKTATRLSEIVKKLKIFMCVSFQLTDESIKCNPENLERLNIANSKQIFRVMDTVLLFKEINKKDYNKYTYMKCKEDENNLLEENKKYYFCKLAKNRIGAKPDLIFEVNLDFNCWKEQGIAVLQ